MADSASEKIRAWMKDQADFPKDATERNKLFEKFCSDSKLVYKNVRSIFTREFEKWLKDKGLNKNDYVKLYQKRESVQGFGLKSEVSVAAKPPPQPQPKPQTQAPQPQSAGPETQATPPGPQAAPLPFSPDVAAMPVTAIVAILRLRDPEIPALTDEEKKIVGESLYPVMAPLIGHNWFQWLMALTAVSSVLGGRWQLYREHLKEKKPEPPKQTEKTQEKTTGITDILPQKEEPRPNMGAREKDDLVKMLKAKGYDETKIRSMLG